MTHIRNWSRAIAGCVMLAVIFGLLCASVITRPDPGGYAGLAVAGAALAGFAVRIIRSGVVVDDEGLTVRNWLRTRRLAWSEIAGFSPAWDDKQHRRIGIALTGGGRVSCPALTNLADVGYVFGLRSPTYSGPIDPNNAAADRLAEAIERRLGTVTRAPRAAQPADRVAGPR